MRLRRFDCVSYRAWRPFSTSAAWRATAPEGRLVCDEIVPVLLEMDAAAEIASSPGSTSAGAVSAIGNCCAFRVGEEPLDLFRRYASVNAREQALIVTSARR